MSVPDFTREYNLKDIVNMWDDVYDGLSFHGVIYNTGFYKALGYKLTEHVFTKTRSMQPFRFRMQNCQIYSGRVVCIQSWRCKSKCFGSESGEASSGFGAGYI